MRQKSWLQKGVTMKNDWLQNGLFLIAKRCTAIGKKFVAKRFDFNYNMVNSQAQKGAPENLFSPQLGLN